MPMTPGACAPCRPERVRIARVTHSRPRKASTLGDALTVGPRRCYPTAGRSVKHRQQHSEFGPAGTRALHVDPAAVGLDDLLGDGEAEPTATSRRRACLV